jgi:hypothetical protein
VIVLLSVTKKEARSISRIELCEAIYTSDGSERANDVREGAKQDKASGARCRGQTQQNREQTVEQENARDDKRENRNSRELTKCLGRACFCACVRLESPVRCVGYPNLNTPEVRVIVRVRTYWKPDTATSFSIANVIITKQ